MKKIIFNLMLLFLIAFSSKAKNIDPIDTRMLTQPTISINHIAFVYAEDLWVANRDGSNPHR